jgi:RNA polymerase sigma factor (sigma-70 family)
MSTHTPTTTNQRPPAPSDVAALVRAAADGDAEAWRELVARYGGLLWSVARGCRLSPSDAADVVQATWLKFVLNLDTIKNPDAVGAWLATTARRECLRIIDASKCQIPAGDELPEPRNWENVTVDEELLTAERDTLLWRAVKLLRPEDQALVRLLASDPPASYTEISAALDMPVGSIGPTRARCLERLRAHCEQLELCAA